MFLSFETVEGFAVKRSPSLSLPYLKENGELLSIAYHAGLLAEPRALSLYEEFYNASYDILTSYPQYYRFVLGLVLSLEALGQSGHKSHDLCTYVIDEAMINFDTSDSRRLEAIFLLSRNADLNAEHLQRQTQATDNLGHFLSNPKRFTKFNKPLFYELTHFVFFLTEYGAQTTPFKDAFAQALMYVGLLSLLDHDADLLAEVGVCLKFLGLEVPDYWDEYLVQSLSEVEVKYETSVMSSLNPAVDEYHLYLVLNWYHAMQKRPVFTEKFNSRTPNFVVPERAHTPLSQLSDLVHQVVINKQGSGISRDQFLDMLSDSDREHFEKTIKSAPQSENLLYEFSNGILN